MCVAETTRATLCALLLAWAASGSAQEVRLEDSTAAAQAGELGAIDLSEVVMSATKMVTTVQETPAIVTVITDEEIRARGYRSLDDILDTLPGFETRAVEWWYSDQFTRGQPRTLLLLWNGVPGGSAGWSGYELNRALPVEFIKRVEILTGPGGVLWGANAFLGIVNVITYDGDTFDGVAFHAGGGDGPGMTGAARSTLAVGQSLFGGRLKLYAGVNFSTDSGPMIDPRFIGYLSGWPPPDADGPTLAGVTNVESRNRRNSYVNLAGNVRVGPVTVDWFYPLLARTYQGLNWVGARTDVGSDSTGNVLSGGHSLWVADFFVTSLSVRQRLGRSLGLVARAYYVGGEDITRHFVALPPGFLAIPTYVDQKYWTCPEPCTQTAVNDAFNDPASPRWGAYRAGGSVDFDLTLPARNRLLFGVEGTRLHNEARVIRYPEIVGGATALAFYAIGRSVGGAFVADEWRAHPRLTLHGGARFQAATDYDPVTLFSGAAVWNPYRKLFLKLNYAEGFRPPALTKPNDNRDQDPAKDLPLNLAAHIAYNPDLRPEHSRSAEASASLTALERHGAVDKVILRGGYAFTQLQDLISEEQVVPSNAGNRFIHSGDLSLRIDVRGGSSLFLTYSVNFGFDREIGPLRGTANRKIVLGGRFELIRDHLELDTLLVYLGAREDLDRLFANGGPSGSLPGSFNVRSSDAVVDCLPASVNWRLGLRARNLFGKRLEVSGFVYNLLNEAIYAPDLYYSKRVAPMPQSGPGWSAFVNAILSI